MISCMEVMWPQPMYTSEWVSEAVNTHIYITPRCKSRGGKSGGQLAGILENLLPFSSKNKLCLVKE